MSGYRQGIYEVQNPSKFVGTKNPRFLSSYELTVFKFFDTNPNVLKWGAENVIIPYTDPCTGRKRRYMVDLFVEFIDAHGIKHKEIVEIKPYAQTLPPVKSRGKKKQTLLNQEYTYAINSAKWIAAAKWAKVRKMKFRVITEKDIYR